MVRPFQWKKHVQYTFSALQCVDVSFAEGSIHCRQCWSQHWVCSRSDPGGLKLARPYFQITHNVHVTIIRNIASAEIVKQAKPSTTKNHISLILDWHLVCSWTLVLTSSLSKQCPYPLPSKPFQRIKKFSSGIDTPVFYSTEGAQRNVVGKEGSVAGQQWASSKSIPARKAAAKPHLPLAVPRLAQHQRPNCNEAGDQPTNQLSHCQLALTNNTSNWNISIITGKTGPKT